MTLAVNTLSGRAATGEAIPFAHTLTPPQEEKKEVVKQSSYDWRTIIVASALALSILCLVTTLALFQPVYAAAFGILSVGLVFATYFVHQYTKLRSLSEQVDALEANNVQLREVNYSLQKVNFDLRLTSKANLAQLALLEKQNWELHTSLGELEEHREGLRAQEKSLRAEVDRLRQAMDELTSDSIFSAKLGVLNEINGQIHSANHELGATSTALEMHRNMLETEKAKLEALTTKLAETEERIGKTEASLRDTADKMARIVSQEDDSFKN